MHEGLGAFGMDNVDKLYQPGGILLRVKAKFLGTFVCPGIIQAGAVQHNQGHAAFGPCPVKLQHLGINTAVCRVFCGKKRHYDAVIKMAIADFAG